MNTWIISANGRVFDHARAFSEQGFIDWKQTRNYTIGDIVYIYCTSPLSQIRFCTKVIGINMDNPCETNNQFWLKKKDADQGNRFFRLQLIKATEKESLRLVSLQEHGLKCPPQSPTIVKPSLLSFLHTEFGQGDNER